MAGKKHAAQIREGLDCLKKRFEDFSIDLKKAKKVLCANINKLRCLKKRLSVMENKIFYRKLYILFYRKLYILFISSLKEKQKQKVEIGESSILTSFEMKIPENSSQVEAIEKQLQVQREILKYKLGKAREIQTDLRRTFEANQWKSKVGRVKNKIRTGVCREDFLDEWLDFEKETTDSINDWTLYFKKMGLQAKRKFSKLNNKIISLEESLEQIINDTDGLKQIMGCLVDFEPKPTNMITFEKNNQNANTFLADLKRENCEIEKENPESKKSLRKMREKFGFHLQQIKTKLAKEEEKSRSLQSENGNGKYLEEIAKRDELPREKDQEIAKRDELLREKDQEIEELRRDLEKYRELKNAQEETEAKLVKLEAMQELNVTIIQEKYIRIEQLQGFTREIDGTLNKISELNNNQDDNLQVKEEDGLESGKEYMKETSSLEERITEKSKFSLRGVSQYHSVNGKRNLDSLLADYEEDSGVKSTSKSFSTIRNLKNGKENVDIFSEKDDQGLEHDQVMKKIKQE